MNRSLLYRLCTGSTIVLLAACGSSSGPAGDSTGSGGSIASGSGGTSGGSSGGTGGGSGGAASNYPVGAKKYVPFVSGHRGGSGYAPEDTMSSYRNGARIGIDDFETDTSPTKDGVLVLIHDDSVDRTTNCTGKVNSFTYADLEKCDAGYWWSPGQHTTSADTTLPHPYRGRGVVIPTAQELFDFAKSLGPAGPTVTIEIKNGPNEAEFEARCETTATKLVKMIQDSGIEDRITVQSFDPSCLDNVKSKDATLKTLYLAVEGAEANLAYCVAMGHTFSSPPFDSPDADATWVSNAHAAGVKVNPYTPDLKTDLQHEIGLGVDAAITNFPACFMQLEGRAVPARMLGDDADPAAADVAPCPAS